MSLLRCIWSIDSSMPMNRSQRGCLHSKQRFDRNYPCVISVWFCRIKQTNMRTILCLLVKFCKMSQNQYSIYHVKYKLCHCVTGDFAIIQFTIRKWAKKKLLKLRTNLYGIERENMASCLCYWSLGLVNGWGYLNRMTTCWWLVDRTVVWKIGSMLPALGNSEIHVRWYGHFKDSRVMTSHLRGLSQPATD